MMLQPKCKLVRTPPNGWRLEFTNLPVYVVGSAPYASSDDRAHDPRPLFMFATGEAYIKATGAISSIRILQHQQSEWCSALWPVPAGELFEMLKASLLITEAKQIAAAVQELHTQREAA